MSKLKVFVYSVANIMKVGVKISLGIYVIYMLHNIMSTTYFTLQTLLNILKKQEEAMFAIAPASET